MSDWLKPERERTSQVWQQVERIFKENLNFKNKTEVLETALDVLELMLEPRKPEKYDYEYDCEHFRLCQKRHMLKHFPDYYFTKEELEKLRERYPNKKRFRKEREKA
jgi:hypothetical protein